MSHRKLLVGLFGIAALVCATTAVPAASAATPACQVAYTVSNSWPGGFQGSVVVTNNAAAVTSWTLGFTFPGNQQVSSGWNGTWTQSGAAVTVASASWNGSLATGGSVTLGFTGTFSGTNTNPTAFTFNGTACNGGTTPPPGTPSVSLTSPTANQTFTAGSSVPLTASASESGGTIS